MSESEEEDAKEEAKEFDERYLIDLLLRFAVIEEEPILQFDADDVEETQGDWGGVAPVLVQRHIKWVDYHPMQMMQIPDDDDGAFLQLKDSLRLKTIGISDSWLTHSERCAKKVVTEADKGVLLL